MPRSGEDVREFFVPVLACPSEGVAAVEFVLDEWICSEIEQGDDGFAMSRLCGEMDRGHAFSVTWSPEGAALIGVGAKFYEGAN